MAILLLIIGLLLFIGLVVVHELGHFIVARRNGVVAEEFGIFFPPRLYKRKMKGGWVFSINLLPLGGFVKLKGEHDSDTAPGTFGAASLWAKSKIMAAGVVMNLVIGVILLSIVAIIGMPKIVDNQFTVKRDTKTITQTQTRVQVGAIEPASPATKSGLRAHDVLVSIGLPGTKPVTVKVASDLTDSTKKFAGKTVDISYKRGNTLHKTQATLNSQAAVNASKKSAHPQYYLGVELNEIGGITLQRSTWSAPIVAFGLTGQFTVLTLHGLGHAVAGLGSIIAGIATNNQAARESGQTEASSQVGGPVAIFYVLRDGSSLGWSFVLFIIAIISLTLAIMNLLPIPALDGGRLWLTLLTHAIKKPLSARREELINFYGFAFLMFIFVLITIVDVKRFNLL